MDYISREAAFNAAQQSISDKRTHDFNAGCARAANNLLTLPAADVREVVWKPVVGFEGLYEVSNFGAVRNRDALTMKQGIKHGKGTSYKTVRLWKEGKYYGKYVHRLVAEAFIPNSSNLPFVNHKDEDGTNNELCNLEWCSQQYNANYGTARERQRRKLIGRKHTGEHKKKISESLYKYYDDGFMGRRVVCVETGVAYDSIAKAARDLGISEATIRMSCNRQTEKGRKYTFRDCLSCGAMMGGKE